MINTIKSQAIWFCSYTLLYAGLFWLAGFVVGLAEYSLWFPAAALRFAAFLIFGVRVLPLVLLGEVVAQPALDAFGLLNVGNLTYFTPAILVPPLVYGLGLHLVVRFFSVDLQTVSIRETIILTLAGLAMPFMSALLSSSLLLKPGMITAETQLGSIIGFWVGDAVGVAMLAPPLLLVWYGVIEGRQGLCFQLWPILEVLGVLLLGGLFFGLIGLSSNTTVWYPALLPLIWLALRFELTGAAAGIFLLNLLSAGVSALEAEPTARFELQLFLMTASVMALLLASLAYEQRKAAETIRDQAQKVAHMDRITNLGQMAATLVHEINQPLTAIRALAKTGGTVQQIDDEARHIQAIMARTRALAENKAIQRAPISLSEVVDDLSHLLRAEAKRHSVDLQIERPSSLPAVLGDTVQISQVILNLVRNGLEAAKEQSSRLPRVTLAVSHTHSSTEITVTDNGPAISQEALATLFKPFWTTKANGLGMGLSITKDIVTAHDGTVQAQQRADGGLEVRVKLPVAP